MDKLPLECFEYRTKLNTMLSYFINRFNVASPKKIVLITWKDFRVVGVVLESLV